MCWIDREEEIIFYCRICNKHLNRLLDKGTIKCQSFMVFNYTYEKIESLINKKHNPDIIQVNLTDEEFNCTYFSIVSYINRLDRNEEDYYKNRYLGFIE